MTRFSDRHNFGMEDVPITVRRDAPPSLRQAIPVIAQECGVLPRQLRNDSFVMSFAAKLWPLELKPEEMVTPSFKVVSLLLIGTGWSGTTTLAAAGLTGYP